MIEIYKPGSWWYFEGSDYAVRQCVGERHGMSVWNDSGSSNYASDKKPTYEIHDIVNFSLPPDSQTG